MKTISLLSVGVALLSVLSFTTRTDYGDNSNIAGTYGAFCNEGENENVSTLQLVLNDDKTFQYVDKSIPSEVVNVSGKWKLYEGDIYLVEYPAVVKIPKIWKQDKDTPCLKARKGTMFIRLCKK